MGLKRSKHSCPRRVNAGNKSTPSTHHPRRRNVTTSMIGLTNKQNNQQTNKQTKSPTINKQTKIRSRRQKSHLRSGGPQRYSWECRKRRSYTPKGGRNSSVGSAWARCPQRRGFDPPLGTFSGRGDFSLGVNMGSNSIPPRTLSDESINRGLVCAHMHSITRDSKDPNIHVLDG